ncbi:MAG: ABC transporter permease [Deltaproteobacteria bacterium]|nr:ABC transporter permease [Deltaproteobacteria bacterium]
MKALDRKVLRDLWALKAQAAAIAAVIVSGVATLVLSVSTLDSLRLTQASYYRDCAFADVFASLVRAPEGLGDRLRAVPGVDRVQTRVVGAASLTVPGFDEPVRALVVSIPDSGEPLVNRLHLRQGRLAAPEGGDEVVVSETLAEAHGLSPGAALDAILHGRRRRLTVVGVALSPEHIYQIAPGALFPDYRRYGVLWMARTPLASAYGLEGAFNDVAATLGPGASLEGVLERLDALLAPYGGRGAYGRRDQTSHRFLSDEMRQLRTTGTVFPTIFLGVAAFLLNIVVSRTVALQREQVATLKAFGYGNGAIALHYAKLLSLIVAAGVAGGLATGAWLGRGLSRLYMEYYRFPYLDYVLRPSAVGVAVLVSGAACLAGALHAVRRAAALPPAEAMRPEAPERYRVCFVERLGLGRFLSQPARMIARHIGRQPLKAALTILGLALACAILMLSGFESDAVDFMVDTQFRRAQREDLLVTFTDPSSRSALHELESLDGVFRAEGFRVVPVRLRRGHRTYRTAIQGEEPGSRLRRLFDAQDRPVVLPPTGLVFTDYLGGLLQVAPGETVTVEVLEGARAVREVPVAGLVSQYVGVSAYMDLDALNRLLGEGDAVSGAALAVDAPQWPALFAALAARPRVASTVARENAIRSFYEMMGQTLLVFVFVNAVLAATIAGGVVYNSARVSLSERSRELASLRVLGYTRGEISYILLGELAVLTLAAVPLGFLMGYGLCAYLSAALRSDLYRIPLVMTPETFAFSALVVLSAAGASALLVRRRLDHLDLVAVLKTRE